MKPLQKSVLHLNLHREFFAQIVAGTKRTEYRDQTKYWKKRLEGRNYDLIRFRNGYLKNAPEMDVEFLGVRRESKGSGDRFAIRLGHRLSLKRWKS